MTAESKAKEQEQAPPPGEVRGHCAKDESSAQDQTGRDPEQLREEIKETRDDLGETVEALVQKADIRSQLQQKVAERKDALRAAKEQAKQKVADFGQQTRERRAPLTTAAVALVAGLVVLWLIRRR